MDKPQGLRFEALVARRLAPGTKNQEPRTKN